MESWQVCHHWHLFLSLCHLRLTRDKTITPSQHILTTIKACLFNKSWMDVGKMLDGRSVKTVSTQFNIFKNKENVESMLNESLNQFKFDSTHFQQAFSIFWHFQQRTTTCSNTPYIWFNNCVEHMVHGSFISHYLHKINIEKYSYNRWLQDKIIMVQIIKCVWWSK